MTMVRKCFKFKVLGPLNFIEKQPHLKRLPIEPYKGALPRILIGLDNWRLGIPLRCEEGEEGDLIATKTRLGWCVSGPCNGSKEVVGQSYSHLNMCECRENEESFERLVKNLFSLESLGVAAPKVNLISNDDARTQEMLETTAIRVGNRFETGLLWRYDRFELPDSYPMALRRLGCLNKKMSNDPELN